MKLAALNVTEPPVPSPRLHGRHPTTQRIQSSDYCDPDHVNPSQADSVSFWIVAILGEKLLSCESLRATEYDGRGVYQIKMRDIECQRCTAECQQYIPHTAVQTFGESTNDRGGS